MCRREGNLLAMDTCTQYDRAVLQWTLEPKTALRIHGRGGFVWEVRVFKFSAESETQLTPEKEKEQPKSHTPKVISSCRLSIRQLV